MRLTLLFIFLGTVALAQKDTISVMSWNVFLRPAILKDGQMSRVDSISDYLKHSNHDILVLQEVFHRKARKKLISELKNTYPHATTRGPSSFWGVSSGVLILSKFPIEKTSFQEFRKAKGSDALAKKGVMRANVRIGNELVQVYGTHLQAGGGEKRHKIRQKQLNLIRRFVEHEEDSAIQIVAGDFNIQGYSAAFDSVAHKLEVELPKLSGERKHTANFGDQDLFETSGNAKWIDFIFLRRHRKSTVIETEIEEPRMQVETDFKRLSDHNPIISKIEIDSGI